MGDVAKEVADTLTAAKEGRATVTLKQEEFIHIDRDCDAFKDAIKAIKIIMSEVSQQPHWGLGDDNGELVSGTTLVTRFKEKANGAADGNSVHAIMDQHLKIVQDIQDAHKAIRELIMQTDSNWAAEYNRVNNTTTTPNQAPVQIPVSPSPRGLFDTMYGGVTK